MAKKYLEYKRKQENPKNKNIGFILIWFFFAIVLLVGGSYAYLKTSTEGAKKVSVIAGILKVKYEDQEVIQLENTYPMSDEEGKEQKSYRFSVENVGDMQAKYDIGLEESKKNTLDKKHIKYILKKGSGEWSNPQFLSSLNSLVIEESKSLSVGEKEEYEIKMWVDIDSGNDIQGKSYKAKVVVTVSEDAGVTKDVMPPIIHLKGDLSVNVEEHTLFQDPGIEKIVDNRDQLKETDVKRSYEYYDGENTVQVENVDSNQLGVYYIYYKIKDKSGNEGVAIRSVNIYHKDTTSPTMKLIGSKTMRVEIGTEYVEQGATAIDREDGDISNRIVTIGTVNTKRIGTYPIKYLVTDSSGNTASIARTVNVVYPATFMGQIELDITEHPSEQITFEGDHGNLSYESNNSDIATVDANGMVTGVKVGKTEIIAHSSKGYDLEIEVIVEKTIKAQFIKQGLGVTEIGAEEDSCVMSDLEEGCSVTLPKISVKTGYTAVGWNQEKNALEGTTGETQIYDHTTYYAISYKNEVTYTVNFDANGNEIDATSKSCILGKSYNDTPQVSSCELTTPTITAPQLTPTVIGYNQDASATSAQVGSNAKLVVNVNNQGKTYYAITMKGKVTYKVNFAPNGNEIDATSKTCDLPAVYNGEEQTTSCELTTPTITAPANTPTIVGYNQDASETTAQVGSNSQLTVDSNNQGKTYYAITKSVALTYTVNFNANGNIIDATSKSCDIGETYNGVAQETSCTITTPTITAPANTPTVVGYNRTATATTSEIGSGEELEVTNEIKGATYYAITKSAGQDVSYVVNFAANGNIIAATSKSCTVRGESYNGQLPSSSCTVTTPVITAPAATPTIVGYNQTASATTAQVGSNASLTVNISNQGKTYYAITKHAAVTRTAYFKASTGVSGVGAASRACTIAETFNGRAQGTACSVTTPTITPSSSHTVVGWATSTPTSLSATGQNVSISISSNPTYYAYAYRIAASSKKTSGSYDSCKKNGHKYRYRFTITAVLFAVNSGKICYASSSSKATSHCCKYKTNCESGYGDGCFTSTTTWDFYRDSACAYAYVCNKVNKCTSKYQC